VAVVPTATQPHLLLKPHEAARSLKISERQLWAHTAPRGPIPATRIGNCVRYSPEALQRFIATEEAQNGSSQVTR